jgi:hypothetical protein
MCCESENAIAGYRVSEPPAMQHIVRNKPIASALTSSAMTKSCVLCHLF